MILNKRKYGYKFFNDTMSFEKENTRNLTSDEEKFQNKFNSISKEKVILGNKENYIKVSSKNGFIERNNLKNNNYLVKKSMYKKFFQKKKNKQLINKKVKKNSFSPSKNINFSLIKYIKINKDFAIEDNLNLFNKYSKTERENLKDQKYLLNMINNNNNIINNNKNKHNTFNNLNNNNNFNYYYNKINNIININNDNVINNITKNINMKYNNDTTNNINNTVVNNFCLTQRNSIKKNEKNSKLFSKNCLQKIKNRNCTSVSSSINTSIQTNNTETVKNSLNTLKKNPKKRNQSNNEFFIKNKKEKLINKETDKNYKDQFLRKSFHNNINNQIEIQNLKKSSFTERPSRNNSKNKKNNNNQKNKFDTICLTFKTPIQLKNDIMKVLSQNKIYFQNSKNYMYKFICEKNNIKFEIEIHRSDKIDKSYNVNFIKIEGNNEIYHGIKQQIVSKIV